MEELMTENLEQVAEQATNADTQGAEAVGVEALARAEAEDLIRGGYEKVVEKVEQMAQLGVQQMNDRQKALFKNLAQYRQGAERGMELAKIGVSQDVYTSRDFTDFAAQFRASTPAKRIYELYEKSKPKKEFQTMGTMKSAGTTDDGVKDYYAFEEARRFTKRDFDRNPKLFAAVQRSMTKW